MQSKTVLPWRPVQVMNLVTGDIVTVDAPCAECAVQFAAMIAKDYNAEMFYGKHTVGCGSWSAYWDMSDVVGVTR